MRTSVHDRIEAIAGAIALGEASDDERREYREHISSCHGCLNALGGELEIERVASTVARARDEEVWEPYLGDVVEKRMRRRARAARLGLGACTAALAAAFGLHVLFAAGIGRLEPHDAAPVVIDAGATRIVLEQNPSSAKSGVAVPAAPPVQPRLIVTHNVIQIARAPIPPAALDVPGTGKSADKPRPLVHVTVHPQQARTSRRSPVPVWHANRTQWRTVARTTTTSVTETAPQQFLHNAESLQVVPNVTREVEPLGGETAIDPQPPMIAYDEGADGTTAFEVLVDEHGTPTKCVITKSAGYPVLDDAVCRAAMKVRYSPKMVDGRAVPGVYHDAFTFHTSDQTSMRTEGLPRQATALNIPRSRVPSDQILRQGPQPPWAATGGGSPRR